jgi:hypothetical protein
VKVSIPVYLVTLLCGFIAAVLKYYVPTLPITEDQIQWFIVLVLTLAGVDVTQALKAQGFLPRK